MSEENIKNDAALNALARARQRNSKFRNKKSILKRPRFGKQDEIRSGAFPDGRDPQKLGNVLNKFVKDFGWQQPTSIADLMSRWNEIVGEEIASHVSIDIFNADAHELILRADSTTWATQIRLLSSDLKRRIALEVGDGVVKTLKIYGPAQPKQKGLWRVPSMRKTDY
jgi:predicted nucleic acid-binding Zn ribbon protein